jgi:GTP cyclohydrolase I
MEEALGALGLTEDPETRSSAACFVDFLDEFIASGAPPSLSALASSSTDPVLLRSIPFYSLCAHHLLPFFGTADIAYRPSGRIAGLGTLVRLLQFHARRPQVQERLGALVADAILSELGAEAVLVRLRARHMCVEMRGARSACEVVTFCARGASDPTLVQAITS